MRNFMAVVKALADENRVRALMALRERELCVCDIIELLGLAPSTVSKHLSILYQAELVEYRKEGRWVYYRLATDSAPFPVTKAIEWVSVCLENSLTIVRDAKNLKEIQYVNSAQLTCSNGKSHVDEKKSKRDDL